MNELALVEDFQFDAQGFLMLRDVFDAERCRHYLEELERLFARQLRRPLAARRGSRADYSPDHRRPAADQRPAAVDGSVR